MRKKIALKDESWQDCIKGNTKMKSIFASETYFIIMLIYVSLITKKKLTILPAIING